jgi:hypothetical protein
VLIDGIRGNDAAATRAQRAIRDIDRVPHHRDRSRKAVPDLPVNTLSFIDTVAQGLLPNVSFVDPAFDTEGNGTSADDHPLADIRLNSGSACRQSWFRISPPPGLSTMARSSMPPR